MRAVVSFVLVSVAIAWTVAHVVTIPAEQAYAAIFAPIVQALEGR